MLAAGPRKRRAAYVVAEVEVRIVAPARAALTEWHEGEFLPVARHQVQPRLGRAYELLVGRRIAIEEHHARHVHVRAAVLQVEEGCVESCEPPLGHGARLLYASPRESPRAPETLAGGDARRRAARRPAVRRSYAHRCERSRRDERHPRGA